MAQPTTSSGLNARTLFLIGGVGAILAVLIVSLVARQRPVTSADVTVPQLVAQGQTIYRARCASCHGGQLEGQPDWQQPLADGSMPAPPHDPTGHTWHHNDQSLFATVKYGGAATSPPDRPNHMPAFDSQLSDADIWSVLAYIKSTWPADVLAAQTNGHQ